MTGSQDNFPPEGRGGPPPGGYPPAPQHGSVPPPSAGWPPGSQPAPAWNQQYPAAPPPPPPAPPKKRSIGKTIIGVVVALAIGIAVKVGLHSVFDRHTDRPSSHGFDYAVGTCLNLSKTGIMVKPTDVHVEPCSSPTALAKVAKRYQGTKKNCPNEHYGTLEGGGNGFCLEDNLVVGSCYHQAIVTHMFASTACTPGAIDQTFKVALRRDGVDDPGLCSDEQQPVNFPEPPLTYCLDVLTREQP